MTVDAVGICNNALAMIGGGQISAFDEAGDTDGEGSLAQVCERLYNFSVRELLADYEYRFTMTQAQLSRLGAAPLDAWDAKYQLPTDCLLLQKVTVQDMPIRYERYGYEIHCNATSTDVVVGHYTLEPAAHLMAPYFEVPLTKKLAGYLAGAVEADEQLAKLYMDAGERAAIKGKSKDAQGRTQRKFQLTRFRRRRGSVSL